MTPTWTPERVEQLRALAASGKNDKQIAEVFGLTYSAIEYARRNFKVPNGWRNAPPRAMPEGFQAVAATLTLRDCQDRYTAHQHTVQRWFKEAGLKPRGRARKVKVKSFRPAGYCLPTPQPQRDPTQAGRAQSYLQRLGPVFRARTLSPDAPEGQWVVFGRRMEEDAMVEMAVARGLGRWNANAIA